MTQELRRLAEAATQGEWTSENVRGAGIQMRVPYKGTTRMTFTEVFRALPEKEWDAELWANAEYIAAANPAAILELLDRLEKAEKDAARYRWLRDGCDEKGNAASHIAANCYGMEWNALIDTAMEASK